VFRVPAWLPVAVWGGVQAWLLATGDREVAVYSHLGGFAAGVVLGALSRESE
jgi:membrane associated rhomboid family serine protease